MVSLKTLPSSSLRTAVLGGGFALAALVLAAAVFTITGRSAAAGETSSFSPEQKADIERIVKEYLVSHPEVLVEVQTALDSKMAKEQAEKMKEALKENASELFRESNAPVAGNPKGDATVVEFFDYNCGFCKRGLPDIVKLIQTDSKVRVVFKELPILSKGSEEASRVALAARNQGKYWEVHQALLGYKGHVNESVALAVAKDLNLDMERLRKDMQSDAVREELAKVHRLAQKLGVSGTPHFLVGGNAIAGAPDDLFEQLSSGVSELRKTGCSYC